MIIRHELTASLDADTAEYFISESRRFATLIDESCDDLLDLDFIDDLLAELIEPACTFAPLPDSIADFDDNAILALADTIFRFLTRYFLMHDIA